MTRARLKDWHTQEGKMAIQDWITRLDKIELASLSAPELEATLAELRACFSSVDVPVTDLNEIFGLCAMHKNPWIRRTGLAIADRHAETPSARELMCWLVHDPEDFVCFEAVRLCDRHRVAESIKELLPIIGLPSGRVDHVGRDGPCDRSQGYYIAIWNHG